MQIQRQQIRTLSIAVATSSTVDLDRTLPRSRGVRRVAGARLFFPEEYPDLIAYEARRLWRA